MDIFSIMPVEVFADDRLSKTDLRVLGVILSFRNRNTNLCWPKREHIAERCGLPLCKISTATTHLVELGWLEKLGDGGRSRPSHYRLIVPVFLTEMVTESVTVTDSVTVTKSVTKTVTDSVRGIEQTSKHTKVTTTSDAAKKLKNEKKPKAIISRDWRPGDRCIELIARAGIPQAFADGLVDEFILYWEERGDKRSGWEATFVNHAKTQWERQQRNLAGRTVAGVQDNMTGNYDAGSGKIKAGYGAGRKLSLVEQAQRDCERFDERERREQGGRERVVN
jgi:hypothetical protein